MKDMTSVVNQNSPFRSPLMLKSSEVSLRQYSGSRGHLSDVSSTSVGTRVVEFLRARHPVKTADNISAETGIGAWTIAKWLERASVPGGIAILRLAAAYGPEFLLAAYPKAPAWLDAAARAQRLAALDAQLAALE